ncbi:MAG: 4a-hydroxytetrahydrobiopterin dehydratase [Bacteroidota bacterium]
MVDLKEKKCEPCAEGTPPMNAEKIKDYKKNLSTGWQIIENKKLFKQFPFENFEQGMAFVNDVATIANQENHHPDICISYSEVTIELTTHSVGGLSENDFIMAAKIDHV